MSHYLNKEEIAAKTAEVNHLQADPEYMLTLTIRRDEAGYYAEVPGFTRSQNALVAGADILCAKMAQGDNTIEVKFRTLPSDKLPKPLFTMDRILHIHGGTYLVKGISSIPFPAWLCPVTHSVVGSHPEKIYVYGIEHRNV